MTDSANIVGILHRKYIDDTVRLKSAQHHGYCNVILIHYKQCTIALHFTEERLRDLKHALEPLNINRTIFLKA